MQQLLGMMRRAIVDYNMIENGDKVLVGISGGKDSVVLFTGLAKLR
ncbi:MAG: tRNA 2-thiocytidine(32) synthetase TtcA, partial [Angelakisella sp.]